MSSDVLMAGAGHERGDRRHRRVGTLAWLLSVLVAAMLIGGAASAFIGLREDVDGLTALADAGQERADSRDADIAALRHQLESVGIEPAAGGPSISRDGRDGADGRDGRDGATGDPGPAGIDGTNGADGADGADGLNGVDGLPGPQGPPGQSVIGPQGPPGADGVVGPFTFTAGGLTFICTPAPGVSPTPCEQVAG